MKRITSLLLAMVLLLGIVFAGVTPVSAESNLTTSSDGVAMLKKYEGFSKYPYYDYGQYTVGYGTRCPSDMLEYYRANGITEEEAEVLLRNYLARYEKDLNAFADKVGRNFTQNEFDALILFSFNCGSGWIYDSTSNFRNAIVSGAKGNELIYWFSRWCTAGGSILTGLVRRRMCEANMYLNGVYSTSMPENYCYVYYDGNGGTVEGRIQGYDANLDVDIKATATYSGHTFMGWFTAKTGGYQVTDLTTALDGKTLYARWDSVGVTEDPPEEEENTMSVPVTVTSSGVNIRKGPGTNYTIVGSVNKGDKITITATASGSGYEWGKFSKGWIVLDYTSYGKGEEEPEEEEPETTTPAETQQGTIQVNGSLNIRSGPGTGYASVGSYANGTKVEILEQKTVGSMVWGKTNKGWISMQYVKLQDSAQEDDNSNQNQNTGTTTPVSGQTGTITTTLRIRSGPGTNYSIVGYLYSGNKVTITEQKTVGSTTWGKTEKGWVSMNYVKLDKTESGNESEGETSAPSQNLTGTVKVGDYLCVRSGPGSSYAVSSYLYNGNKVTITEQKTVGATTWGKTEKGWVSMDYILLDGQDTDKDQADTDNNDTTTSQPSTEGVTGTIKVSGSLCVRSGAGSGNAVVGYLYNGNKVTITEQKTVGSTTWGKTEKGWISMAYVVLDSQGENQTSTRTVTADCLNVRSSAGSEYGIVGYLYHGAKVEILEQKTVGSVTWGRISTGWISLEYTK